MWFALIFSPVVVVIAAACIVYELTLAQTAAALLGGTWFQYALTIGIYLFALGLGSLVPVPTQRSSQWRRLLQLEFALAFSGTLAPFAAIYIERGLRLWVLAADSGLYGPLVYALIAALALLIGFISGMELPLLLRLGEDRFREGGVLALDYLGTLLGTAFFLVWLLPRLGLFGTAAFAGLATASAGAVACVLAPPTERKKLFLFTIALVAGGVLLWYNRELTDYFGRFIYLAGGPS